MGLRTSGCITVDIYPRHRVPVRRMKQLILLQAQSNLNYVVIFFVSRYRFVLKLDCCRLAQYSPYFHVPISVLRRFMYVVGLGTEGAT